MDNAQFVAFPLQILNGAAALATRSDHIYQMIEQVIFTMPGERVMLPDFGVGLERVLFEANSREILAATESLVAGSLHQWLGDVIAVRDVRVDVVEDGIEVQVQFEITATRESRLERFKR